MPRIEAYPDPAGTSFRYLPDGRPLPPERWAERMRPEDRATLALLFAAVDNADATIEADGVRLTHTCLAGLTGAQALSLGLPGPVPFALEVRSRGTLDRDFRFDYRWMHQGRPVVGAQRLGSGLSVGKHSFRVTEPQFSLLEAMDRFNLTPPPTVEARLLAWGRMQALLGDDTAQVRADDYLKRMRVYPAGRFTLRIAADTPGEPQITPVLLQADGAALPLLEEAIEDHIEENEAPHPEPLLPAMHQKAFVDRFGQFDRVQPRYVLRDGWYVVLDDTTRRALDVVRQVQKAPSSQRRDFIRNPRAYLRGALEDVSEEALEALFVETEGYSERVEGLGLWQPKVLPWLQRASQPWLPPEGQGLLVDGRPVSIAPEQVEVLRAQIEAAIAAGRTDVSFQGTCLPANAETLAGLSALETSPSATVVDEDSSADEMLDGLELPDPLPIETPLPAEHHVLLIKDNLEELSYAAKQRPHRPGEATVPPLKSMLKPHQIEGLHWLQAHWHTGSRGALLADDMGLGKTLQALAFMAWLREEMAAGFVDRGPLLIVAPTGLLRNWEDEASMHLETGALGEQVRAYGPELARLKVGGRGVESLDGVSRLNREALHRADWVLTTYETLRDYHHSFAVVPFVALIFDEVQKIKNPAALVTETAKAMRADFIVAMTGTPVENRLADLWCIADTAQPGLLGDLKGFSALYEVEGNEAALRALKTKIWHGREVDVRDQKDSSPRLMLRRLKAEKLPTLPEKHAQMLARPMPPRQAARYREVVLEARKGGRGRMLQALQDLRQVSLHPCVRDALDDTAYIQASARLSTAIEVLDGIQAQKEKALVFLESLEMQEILTLLLQRRYKLAQRPLIINGSVPGEKRKDRVDLFQSRPGFDVMLLSPRAGGVGLTLTAANHVIHLSRWWNPAVEDQCTDRVHRIGQHRPVHVYYPLAIDPASPEYSFDQRLHALLEDKRRLSQELLVPSAMSRADEVRLFESTVELSS